MENVIAITGSGGFIGTSLVTFFLDLGYQVIEVHKSDFKDFNTLKSKISTADIIINLAGKSIFGRWTKKNKKEILGSRIFSTRLLIEVLNTMNPTPYLINASAVGIYQPDETHNETSIMFASGFLSEVVQSWEKEAKQLNNKQLTIARFGVVLDSNGGAFQQIAQMAKFRLGVYFGNGQQAFPFIHLQDLLNAFHYIIHNRLYGLINMVAPEPCSFQKLIVGVKKKYHFFLILPLPYWLLKLFLGEAAEFILKNPYVIPQRLIKNKFKFIYPTIEDSVNALI